jgi:hypothetical protein
MIALLMAVAILDPANVQAYTVPAGLYLIALGLMSRRSPDLWRPHLSLREASQILGVAALVLPQAAQTFEPGGARWGLVLLLEGALFLAIARVLDARWMAIGGAVTLTGVVFLGLAEGGRALPPWVTLGAAGLMIALAGFFLRREHEWWTDVRHRAAVWWRRPPGRAP